MLGRGGRSFLISSIFIFVIAVTLATCALPFSISFFKRPRLP